MTVTFYTISKEINSTFRPSGEGASYSCLLKAPCDLLAPRLELNLGGSSAGSPQQFNYAYLEEFNRYYWVSRWEYNLGLWIAYLNVDALASWKDEIGESTQYVTRSSAEYNGAVADGSYPGLSTTYIASIEKDAIWENAMESDSGTFVVSISGNDIEYYAMSRGNLTSFLDYVFSEDYLQELYGADWSTEYKQLKTQANPMQYINSLRWYPMIISGAAVSRISVGWVDCPVAAVKVNTKMPRQGSITFGKISHPQSGSRGAYLNGAPYSYYSLFVPPFGLMPVDSAMYANSTGIRCDYNVDIRTGFATMDAFYTHATGGDTMMLHTSAPFAVDYQLTRLTSQSVGWGDVISHIEGGIADIASSALGVASSAKSGDKLGAASQAITSSANFQGSLTSFITDSLAARKPFFTSTGSPGGSAGLIGKPALYGGFTMMANDDNAHHGRPLCASRQISTLSGYVQCSDVHLNIPGAYPDEIESINAMMTGGFYYE